MCNIPPIAWYYTYVLIWFPEITSKFPDTFKYNI